MRLLVGATKLLLLLPLVTELTISLDDDKELSKSALRSLAGPFGSLLLGKSVLDVIVAWLVKLVCVDVCVDWLGFWVVVCCEGFGDVLAGIVVVGIVGA